VSRARRVTGKLLGNAGPVLRLPCQCRQARGNDTSTCPFGYLAALAQGQVRCDLSEGPDGLARCVGRKKAPVRCPRFAGGSVSLRGWSSNGELEQSIPASVPPELRERAVRTVREVIAGERVGAVTRVARQVGIGPESLRDWVKQAEIDNGKRPGVTEQQRRISELERENHELRRANEILKRPRLFSHGNSTRDCRSRESYH